MRVPLTAGKLLTGLLVGGLLLPACGPPDTVEIEGRRIVKSSDRRARPGITSAERFGAKPPAPPRAPFSWTLPPGWEELPSSGMRVANLRPAGNADADCSLIVLGGNGGGLAANIDRWRAQLGLGPMAPGEAEALPIISLLGQEATRVDLTGSYSGMGDEARENWGMLGAILITDQFTIFAKMTGPAGLIQAEGGAFDAFCASVQVQAQDAPAHAPQGASPEQPSDQAPAHPPAQAPAQAQDAGASAQASKSRFQYDLPQGWSEAPPRSLRAVNLALGEQTQCYIVTLSGEAGGLMANVNRWRAEVGGDPIPAREIEDLPTVRFLDRDCPLLEVSGDYEGVAGDQGVDQTLLGVLLIDSKESVFVKMVGPRAEVAVARDAFMDFVQTLEDSQ